MAVRKKAKQSRKTIKPRFCLIQFFMAYLG
jgi:hypothetical protein